MENEEREEVVMGLSVHRCEFIGCVQFWMTSLPLSCLLAVGGSSRIISVVMASAP